MDAVEAVMMSWGDSSPTIAHYLDPFFKTNQTTKKRMDGVSNEKRNKPLPKQTREHIVVLVNQNESGSQGQIKLETGFLWGDYKLKNKNEKFKMKKY